MGFKVLRSVLVVRADDVVCDNPRLEEKIEYSECPCLGVGSRSSERGISGCLFRCSAVSGRRYSAAGFLLDWIWFGDPPRNWSGLGVGLLVVPLSGGGGRVGAGGGLGGGGVLNASSR